MNYLSLFQETDLLDGGDNFRCRHYPRSGATELVSRSRYPMLFVLQGELDLHFKYDRQIVTAGNLVVIDTDMLTEFRPASDTVVLIYRPSLRLADLFSQCSRIYETPVSEIVSILPPLQVWIDNLLAEHLQGKVWIDDQADRQRRELAHIMMMDYPRRQLGELYAAFSACALGDCESCQREIAGTAPA